jgi:uncharacterized metal-binding protein YceD (DUF177 family)
MVTLEASEAERQALAKAMDIPGIASLKAELTVSEVGRGRFEVTGQVHSKLSQVCVVTLEPFESEVTEPVEITFAPPEEVERAETAYAGRREEDPTGLEMPEPPDAVENGKIDLGKVAAEFLALALDPYPRKPGVEFQSPEPEGAEDEKESPFAVLAKLKQKPSGN